MNVLPIRVPQGSRDVAAPVQLPTPSGGPPGPVRVRNRRTPVVAGLVIILIFVVGMLLWAALSSITGAVTAPGVVRVQTSLQTLKHLEGGTVRSIAVKDGDRVRRDQLLMTFDTIQPEAQVRVLRQQYYAALAESARHDAELRGSAAVQFPPALTQAASTDPVVSGLMFDQENLFRSRLDVMRSQTEVLGQRIQQLETRIDGFRAQVDSTDAQASLIREELQGLQALYEKGYAPKTRLLALQRTAAGLGGRKGELVAEISRSREGIGEARIQMVELRQKRLSEAAEGRTRAQERIADLQPRLQVAENTLKNTEVRSPVDGFVINLSQNTVGGVAAAGETLMDVVPVGAALIVDARVRPQDVDEVSVGQPARVRLSAYDQQRVPDVSAEVRTVSADRLTDERSGEPYFRAVLQLDPDDLRRLSRQVRLAPGMPADTMIMTQPRTVLDYVVGPIRDTLTGSLREQ